MPDTQTLDLPVGGPRPSVVTNTYGSPERKKSSNTKKIIIAIAVLPLSVGVRVLAIALELLGLVVYLWAWGSVSNATHNA